MKHGFTFIELLVAIAVIAVLVVLMVAVLARAREQSRRASCGNNVGNMIKCCHLYADSAPNQGMFPIYGTDANANGLKALNLLYNGYIKDHRVFSCPGNPTKTDGIPAFNGNQAAMPMWLMPEQTQYGYDPGHRREHATAGVVADFSDDPTRNSANHGAGRPGQNVAIGAGSVEWTESPDGIYTGDDDESLPVELRTFIIQ